MPREVDHVVVGAGTPDEKQNEQTEPLGDRTSYRHISFVRVKNAHTDACCSLGLLLIDKYIVEYIHGIEIGIRTTRVCGQIRNEVCVCVYIYIRRPRPIAKA